MFFAGSLQEALASAVQSNKAVVCFVTGERLPCPVAAIRPFNSGVLLTRLIDEGEESQRWESDFLTEDSV